MDFQSDFRSVFYRIRIEAPDIACLDQVRYRFPTDTFLIYLQDAIYKMCFCGIEESESPEPPTWFMSALAAANRGNLDSRLKESFTDQPGTYLAYGKRPPPGTKWLRVYWNVHPRGAVTLVEAATATFNRDLVPFQLKVLLNTRYRRRDAAVLYLPADQWSQAQPTIQGICRQLATAGHLLPYTPLFTKKLRRGVGFAEDPGNRLSFGTHRSWIVARTLAQSYVRNHDADQQWADLVAEFEQEGLSIDRPYLNPGSKDCYEL
jgi:hypothetical protein